MNSSRSQNPFLLVLLTVGLLGLLSLLKPGLTVGGVALRPVRLLADVLRPDTAAVAALDAPPPNGPAGPSTVAVAAQAQELARADSAAAQDARDSIATAKSQAKTKAPVVPNLGGLDSFLAALHAAKANGSKVRIAYFGDSMIEGDLLTGDLRNSLQAEFGGTGVGFVPINSITAEYRETIHQTFSPDWYEYNLVSDKLPAKYPLGVSGHVFLPREVSNRDSTGIVSDTSWAQFRAEPHWPNTRRLEQARLLYGPGSGRDQVLVTTDNHRVPHALPGHEALNELLLTPGTPARRMRFDFAVRGPRPVYGVSFESPGGITLDNFSFRGNSGMSLTRIPFKQLEAFGQVQDYRLVVLHYGVNVADARNKDYDWYARAMTRVVDRMQRAFPHASILIVGMSDKSSRINGEFVTDPSVARLVKSQRQLAERNHAAFWNLFEAMGGEGTMTSWVTQSPPLGNKDYTHINSRGARKIAGLLYQFLMQEYAHPSKGAGPAGPAVKDSATAAASANQ